METLALELRAFNPAPRIVILRQAGWPGEAIEQLSGPQSVSVSKPVQESDLLASMIQLTTPEHRQTPMPTRPSSLMRQPLHLLLAEDNLVNQKLALAILKKQGHSVVIARNGREAVEAVEREAFDAVLMDVQMPEMSGLEAAQAIRKLELAGQLAAVRECYPTQGLPIIAMTAHVMTGDRERCLEAGMNSYLSKPIQPDLLLKALDELVPCASPSPTTQDRVSTSGLPEQETPTVLEAFVYYDRASALRRIGGDESLLGDLMDLFVEDYPKQLHRIRDAQERGDHTALHSYAHTLKGTISHFSAARALKAAGHLEEIAMGRDLEAIQEGIAKLEDELNLLKETFRQAANDREISRA